MRQTFLSKPFANSLKMQKQYEKMFGKRVMTRSHKSTDNNKTRINLFFTTISTPKKLFLFFSARAEKGIARHVDESRYELLSTTA